MAGRPPVVTVVTPVYNGGRFLAECVESVLGQTYEAFEYVISDNHSTDGTGAVLARYAAEDARIRVVRPPRFLPQITNWNFAVAHASPQSAYLKFLEADDALAPTCLEKMVALADAHPSVGLVGSLRRVSDGEVNLDGIPPTTDVVPGDWLVRSQLSGGRYTTGTPTATLIRLERARASGRMYDESYVHADDALAYRLLLDSDFGYVAEPLTFTRLHEGSTTSWSDRVGTWLPEHLRMTLEFGSRVLSGADLDRIVRRREESYAVMLAKWTITLKLARDREALRYQRTALRLLEQATRAAGRRLSPVLRAYATVLAAERAESTPTTGLAGSGG
jgi:glycosyltransferase involved in cell wall biosynthesis